MKLEIKDIIIDKKQVLKFLGYGKKQAAPIILKKLDQEIEKSKKLFDPIVLVKGFQIEKEEGKKISFAKYSIESKYALEELRDVDSIYLALYTIGDRLDKKIEEYSNTSEMIRAMILDKIGVVALDNIKHQIKDKISKQIAPLNISTELYPAQKDFHISNQKIIFDIFKNENSVMSISKHYQLNPIKTVAVLFGISKEIDEYDMCSRCDNKCY